MELTQEMRINPQEQKEFIYRSGPAPKLIEPQVVNIAGDIKTVNTFLKSRYGENAKAVGTQVVDPGKAVLFVDKDNLTITLKLDPESVYGGTVSGKLSFAEELTQWHINEKKTFDRNAFLQLLKFNGMYFPKKEQHIALQAALKNFESTVTYNTRDESDERGRKDIAFKREVLTKVPEQFALDVPIYKGFDHETFLVDICIDVVGGQLLFWLESVQLEDLKVINLDKIFNEQLKAAEGLVIINK